MQRKTILTLLLPVQFLIVQILAQFPVEIEKYYSNGIYLHISRLQRWLWGGIPFSVGDLLYLLAGVGIIYYLFDKKSKIWKLPKQTAIDVLSTLSVAYFLFYLLWGMNYYRPSLQEKFDLEATYTIEELTQLTEKFVNQANQLHYVLAFNKGKKKRKIPPVEDIYAQTLENYQGIAERLPEFKYESPSLKKSLLSKPLSYMGYGGYLNPFTGEAQTNSLIPNLRQPTLMAHEIGHQLGYASESDTNFIGFLTNLNSNDLFSQYTAYSHALSYLLRDLQLKNEKLFQHYYAMLHPQIIEDYKTIRDFWNQYENPLEPFFKNAFNLHLLINKQQKGINSYNQVVGLLIGWYKKNPTG